MNVLSKTASEFVFQLTGDNNVPYIVQVSTNLVTWISASTNVLSGGPLNVTNFTDPSLPVQFWRAVWLP